ncbi:MAG TPA: MFS transporter [Actinomycetes bacterium]|jgi:MFS family permease|nr:MFS transporter [Actinomycetes bacterium]
MSRTTPKPAGARLGPEYYKLWTATAISTLGDGMYLAGLPLLAAQLTRDPLAVSAVTFAAWLPWLLVALASGALVDRWDRRRVLWTADAGRCVLVGTLTMLVLAGWASIWLLATVGFLLGVGQTLFDSAVLAVIPALVSRDRGQLERANGRWAAVMTVGEQLGGPPAGGVAFTVAAWLPFGADAVSFAASAVLLASLRGRFTAPPPEARPAGLRGEIAEGLRFLLGHRVLRALAGMVGAYSLVFMAGSAILVLYARQELGLGSVGFGLLLAALAVGALPGSLLAPVVGRRLRAGTVLVGGVLVEAGAWLAVGLAPSAWVAAAALAADGLVGAVWNVAQLSLRQVLIPDRLLGRVIGAFRLVGFGPAPVGALLGGVLGRTLGLRAPFVVGAVVLAVVALLALPAVNTRSVETARVQARTAAADGPA